MPIRLQFDLSEQLQAIIVETLVTPARRAKIGQKALHAVMREVHLDTAERNNYILPEDERELGRYGHNVERLSLGKFYLRPDIKFMRDGQDNLLVGLSPILKPLERHQIVQPPFFDSDYRLLPWTTIRLPSQDALPDSFIGPGQRDLETALEMGHPINRAKGQAPNWLYLSHLDVVRMPVVARSIRPVGPGDQPK